MISLQNIMFLDIETVSQLPSYNELNESWKLLWNKKADILLRNKEGESPESIYSRAAIYAEFGKIVCISCGIMQQQDGIKKLSVKSFSGTDEKVLLEDFCTMLTKWTAEDNKYLCAHNGKEFDFPYICRRLIINRLATPHILQIAGKKPWEVKLLDTMELWKFGDFKNYTSLDLLAHSLDIDTPKDDIDGSMVGEVFWKENNIERIVHYCQKDVLTIVQVYLRLMGESLLDTNNIEIK